jgi:hypothetical protein
MMVQTASFLRLRWLAVLLLSLLWNTMGSAAAVAERSEFGHACLAANRVMVGGSYESRGGLLRMVAYDTKTGTIGLGKGGHFDGAAEAGMAGIRPETHRGLTMFQREDEVFWANDSLSLSKAVTQSEAAAIQKALEAQFKGQTVKQVQQIGDVFK